MNFSDREMKRFKESMKEMERETLPFEDIPDCEDDMPGDDDFDKLSDFEKMFGFKLAKTDDELFEEARKRGKQRLKIYMELNDDLKKIYGIEDKDERYRILDTVVR